MWSAIVLFALAMLNVAVWHAILSAGGAASGIYPLSSAENGPLLIVLPGGVTLMVDAGADNGAAVALQKALPPGATHIDLGIITAPDRKRYGGYAYLLDHYTFGAFAYNGRSDITNTTDWKTFMAKIAAGRVPLITIGAGDEAHFGSGAGLVVTAPDAVMVHSTNASDTRIAFKIFMPK